ESLRQQGELDSRNVQGSGRGLGLCIPEHDPDLPHYVHVALARAVSQGGTHLHYLESGPSVAWKQSRRNADREALVHATPPEHSKGIQGGDRPTLTEGVPGQASAPLALRPALHPPRRLEVCLDSPRLQSAGVQNPRSLRGRVP